MKLKKDNKIHVHGIVNYTSSHCFSYSISFIVFFKSFSRQKSISYAELSFFAVSISLKSSPITFDHVNEKM